MHMSQSHTHTHACANTDMKLCVYVLQKRMRRSEHARKETEFLRLKRTRLGLDDFESLKVIGRGAFGEVQIFHPSKFVWVVDVWNVGASIVGMLYCT